MTALALTILIAFNHCSFKNATIYVNPDKIVDIRDYGKGSIQLDMDGGHTVCIKEHIFEVKAKLWKK